MNSTKGSTPQQKQLAPVPDHWDAWDGTPLPPSACLRWGYSTGACLCAVLTASYRRMTLNTEKNTGDNTVRLVFGDGKERTLPLEKELPDYPGFAVIRKNGGDDPDCTHGILLAGRMLKLKDMSVAARDDRDLELEIGRAGVRIHAILGIGTATRSGLDCEQGHWAINKGVLAMLKANLEKQGMESGCWLAEVVIPDGEKTARKTLNHTLGVEGGLSILGTTGLVRPFSNEAYLATIRVCLKSASKAGKTAVLCTGHRTLCSAKEWAQTAFCQDRFGRLAEACFVTIADFLGETLRYAQSLGLSSLVIACMPGKLLKYAAGYANTHAAQSSQDMALLAKTVMEVLPGKEEILPQISACTSMRQACDLLSKDELDAVLRALAQKALAQFEQHCMQAAEQMSGKLFSGEQASDDAMPQAAVPVHFALLVTDFSGNILLFAQKNG